PCRNIARVGPDVVEDEKSGVAEAAAEELHRRGQLVVVDAQDDELVVMVRVEVFAHGQRPPMAGPTFPPARSPVEDVEIDEGAVGGRSYRSDVEVDVLSCLLQCPPVLFRDDAATEHENSQLLPLPPGRPPKVCLLAAQPVLERAFHLD